VRRLGAAAVDLCHVASGKVDGFWEYNLHPWDSAAGILIAKEAGATISKMDSSDYSIFDSELLVSNSLIHKEMSSIITEFDNSYI
jgi:myo-inositol-1(or 4)-monophosphatase